MWLEIVGVLEQIVVFIEGSHAVSRRRPGFKSPWRRENGTLKRRGRWVEPASLFLVAGSHPGAAEGPQELEY